MFTSVKQRLIKSGLILIGLLLGLIFTEIGLRIIPEDQLNNMIFHSARGRHLYTTDRNIGWVLKPNLEAESETRDQIVFKVTTNSHGLRDDETVYEKSGYRILVLGDSFAEARQVELVDAFPTTLESCLANRLNREIEVINGGVTAYGLGEEYLFYKHRGVKYDPNLVLVSIFTGNEFTDLDRHDNFIMIRIAGGYRFDLVNGKLKKQWLSWEQPEEPISIFEQFLRRYSLTYKFLRHPDSKLMIYLQENFLQDNTEHQKLLLPPWPDFIYAKDFSQNPKTPPILIDRWLVFEALVKELHAETLRNGHKLAFMIIPDETQAHYDRLEVAIIDMADSYEELATVAWDVENEPAKTITNFLTEQGIPVLNLLPQMQAHDQNGGYDLYYQADLHFNREGHYFASNLLCDWLVEAGLVTQ